MPKQSGLKGDASLIVDSLADDFILDDPNSGQVSKSAFHEYIVGLKAQVEQVRTSPQTRFMDITEVVTKEEGDLLVAWCWWEIPGTAIQGTGLIKVSEQGVVSERLAYYTKLAT